MYATLEMLKLLGACSDGYGRVLKMLGGPSWGMTNPIPWWMGATTTDGLGDATWIAHRGLVIDQKEFDEMFQRSKPLMFQYLAYQARGHYIDAMWWLLGNMRDKPKAYNDEYGVDLTHSLIDGLHACVDAHLIPEDELVRRTAVMRSFAIDGGSSDFRHIRHALLKCFPHDPQGSALNTCITLVEAVRLEPKDELSVKFDESFKAFANAITSKSEKDAQKAAAIWLRIRAHEAKDTAHGRRQASSLRENNYELLNKYPDEQERDRTSPKRKKTTSRAEDFRKSHPYYEALHELQNYNNRSKKRMFTANLGSMVSETNPTAIRRFLKLFDQKNHFAKKHIRGEVAWDGQSLNVELLSSTDITPLVHRDAEGAMIVAAFAITDPILAVEVGKLIQQAKDGLESSNEDEYRDEDEDEDSDEDTDEEDDSETDEDDDEDEHEPVVAILTPAVSDSGLRINNDSGTSLGDILSEALARRGNMDKDEQTPMIATDSLTAEAANPETAPETENNDQEMAHAAD